MASLHNVTDLRAFEAVLSSEERQRAGRFHRDLERRSYVAAHGLLREALTARDGATPPEEWSFDQQPSGRPVLSARFEKTNLRFSLSHCEHAAACIVSEGLDVGIDVESMSRATSESIVRRYFAPSEQTAFAAAKPSSRTELFIRNWTLKEAYVKARGIGLSERALEQVGFDTGVDGALIATFDQRWQDRAADWHFETWAEHACRIALAIRAVGARLIIERHTR